MTASLVLLLFVSVSAADSLRISEIMFAPTDAALEFVEIHNASSEPLPVPGLSLSDERNVPSPVPDPGRPIPAGGYLVLARDLQAFGVAWPGVDAVQVSPWPTLNNDGDAVALYRDGVEIERVSFVADWGEPGRSLERRDPAGPAGHPVNWGASVNPAGATPGRVNSIHAPDRSPPVLLMAERSAPDRVTVSFDEPVDPAGASFDMDGISLVRTGSADDRSDVVLAADPRSGDGTLVVGGVRDLYGNVLATAAVDVAHLPGPGTLRITEVLTKPDRSRPGRLAFVEIMSTSQRPQSTRGLLLSGPRDAYGYRTQSGLPRLRRAIGPRERVVLFDDPRRPDADSLFRAAYPTAREAVAIAVPGWPLPSDPSEILLGTTDAPGLEAVHVALSWHDPAAAEGLALERIDPWSSLSGPAAWTTSPDPAGATPGATNAAESLPRGRPAAPGDLRITEVMYEPGDSQPEFVEIASVSADPVDTNGIWLANTPRGAAPDSVRIGFAPDALPRNGAMVLSWILPTGSAARVADDLTSAFPASSGWVPSSRVRPAVGARALRNEGATLVLHAPDGAELDRLAYGPHLHHPAIRNTRGVSLERVDWTGPASEATNWTSSVHPDGATPGYRDAPAQPGTGSGNRVTVEPRVFTPDGGGTARLAAVRVSLFRGPSQTLIRVFDLAGRTVRTLAEGRLSNGDDVVWWNGLDDAGLPAPTGPYVVLARAWDASGHERQGRGVVILARR